MRRLQIARSAMAAMEHILPSPVAGEGPGVRAGSVIPLTRLLLLAALFLAGPLSTARAAVTWTGNVDPADPTTWTSSTTGYIGRTADGTLTVNSDSVPNSLHDLYSSYGYIGYNSGSTGEVDVGGAGSTWTNGSYLYVGSSGRGTLNVTGGGAVSSTDGYIGYSFGSTGVVTVDGNGSTWSAGQDLLVGDGRNGTLNVTGGGAVSTAYATIGLSASSRGVVTVDGDGSKWTNGGGLNLGDGGNGTLNITGGGAVTVTGDTDVAHLFPFGDGGSGSINFGPGGGDADDGRALGIFDPTDGHRHDQHPRTGERRRSGSGV